MSVATVSEAPVPITMTVEKIQPSDAHSILETRNILNRPLQQHRVTLLVQAIVNGEWSLNGETIKFDVDGNLIDGQHRLAAIRDGGVAVESAVVRGLPRIAQDTVDIGAKRTMGNVLAMKGYSDPNNIARIARLLWQYDHKHLPRKTVMDDPTPGEVLDYVVDHEKVIKDGLHVGRSLRPLLPSLRVSTGSAAYVIIVRRHKTQGQDFFTKLGTGENLRGKDPILVLRNRLIRDAADKRGMGPQEILAVTIKAWNAWREDKPIEVLMWRKDEAFPRAQ